MVKKQWPNGYMPENEIDHTNRNRSDNRIENLREVSRSCNRKNTGNQKNNSSGVKGVHKSGQSGWSAHIGNGKEQHYLGYTKDFEEAVLLRLAAEQCLGWSGCDLASPAYQYALSHGLVWGWKVSFQSKPESNEMKETE